jgi:hypothetical protein
MAGKVKPDAAATARGLRGGSDLEQICPVTTPPNVAAQVRFIVAEIDGDDRCVVEGIAVVAAAPVLVICRKLIEAGRDPARPLHAYREGILCLVVRSLGEGAALTVAEGDRGIPRFRRWKPFRLREGSPSNAPPGEGATAPAGAAP